MSAALKGDHDWPEAIRDHIVGSVSVEPEDFEYPPFIQRGGLHQAYTLFGGATRNSWVSYYLELVA